MKDVYLEYDDEMFEVDKNIYDRYLQTYKVNLFNMEPLLQSLYEDTKLHNDSLATYSTIFQPSILSIIVFLFLLLFLWLIHKIYKDIQTLMNSFSHVQQELMIEIITYYKKIQEFLDERYFCAPLEPIEENAKLKTHADLSNKVKSAIWKISSMTTEPVSLYHLNR